MGRIKEFKVSKAFTIGIKEIAWAQESAERQGLKLSAFIHDLIKKSMLNDLDVVKKPATWCNQCSGYTGFDLIQSDNKDRMKDKWLCEICQEDQTEVIKYKYR